jgi:hypothetical protein
MTKQRIKGDVCIKKSWTDGLAECARRMRLKGRFGSRQKCCNYLQFG